MDSYPFIQWNLFPSWISLTSVYHMSHPVVVCLLSVVFGNLFQFCSFHCFHSWNCMLFDAMTIQQNTSFFNKNPQNFPALMQQGIHFMKRIFSEICMNYPQIELCIPVTSMNKSTKDASRRLLMSKQAFIWKLLGSMPAASTRNQIVLFSRMGSTSS